jgi:hypothetical protein
MLGMAEDIWASGGGTASAIGGGSAAAAGAGSAPRPAWTSMIENSAIPKAQVNNLIVGHSSKGP